MDTITVAQSIAESIERELDRVKAARPGLVSRVERAENIIVTHLSCRRANMVRVRVTGKGARFLVSGSKGAVYVVDPASWSCSCPDAHRRGAGCKHSIACWALWRVSACPAHRVEVAEEVPVGAMAVAEERGSYEVRECSGCLGDGRAYDGQTGAWIAHEHCSGTGRARTFVYPKAGRLRECDSCRERFAGRDLHEVGDDHLTFFEGDELCEACAVGHGVL